MSVVLHQDGLRHLLRDPLGPTGRYIDVKAREVDVRAHNNALGRPGPRVRSTRLFSSIRYGGLEMDSDGLVAYIITDARSPRQDFPYPLAMELGMPSRAGPLPAHQFSQRTWQDFYAQRSPGERLGYGPFPFLGPALRETFPTAAGV